MHANIKPHALSPLLGGGTAIRLCVSNVSLNRVGEYGQATVQYRLEGDNVNVAGSISLEGADLNAWGSDDTYLFNWLAGKLGLTVNSITKDTAPPVVNDAPVGPEGV